jgi:alpha-L-rhamnosidase
MDRTDRRNFLAGGLKAGAALGSGAALAGPAVLAASADPAGAASGAGAPHRLRVNGLDDALGVEPDGLFFSWLVSDPSLGASQGAYRLTVSRTGGSGHPTVWDSGMVRSAQQAFVPYGGPDLEGDTSYRLSVRTRPPKGSWSAEGTTVFTTGLRDKDWQAQWLRPGPADPGPEIYTYLRTGFRAPSAVVRATAYVAAAHKYQLWLNGTQADTGPSFSYPDESYVQATDVTALVRSGQNTVGVLHKWYGAGQGRPESAPGLLLQLMVHRADGSVTVVGTGPDWTEHPAEWLAGSPRNTEGDFVENIDGRLAPLGWSAPGASTAGWTPVSVLGPVGTAPFTALYAQRTRIAEVPVAPAAVHTLSDGTVVVDFGKVYAGRVRIDFRHGTAGRTVSMRGGFLLDPDGKVSTFHGSQGTDMSFSYIQRAGAQTFLPYTFLGFRYFMVENAGEPLGPGQIRFLTRHAVLPADPPATFSTAVPALSRVWSLCTRSALFCSHEQFVDTPTREKGQFLWDASNESESIMRAFGDQNMTWQALRDFERSQARYWPDGRLNTIYPNGDGARSLPEFALRYPEWVWRYFSNTGDRATAVRLAPVAARVTDWAWQSVDPATGLITNLPGGGGDAGSNFIDGPPPAMLYGYDTNVVAITTTNALAVNTARRTADLARLAGDTATATTADARAEALTQAVNAHLLSPDGVYVDGRLPDGSPSAHASQQANALALAYGLVPAGAVSTVGAHVAALGVASGPPRGLELIRALHAAGRPDAVVHMLTDPKIPGWANELSRGGTFTWESWAPNDLEGDSMSHGWGSSALVGMQEALVGVATAPPDGQHGAVVEVAPPAKGLASASGSIPTVAGPLAVSWRRRGGRLTVDLQVPANALARVHLPAGSASAVTADGSPGGRAPGVRPEGSSAGVTVVAVGAGRHRLSA